MTKATFISDLIKTNLLTIAFIPLINYAALWIIENGGSNFHNYLWLFGNGALGLFMVIFPNFIQPLFNKFVSLGKGKKEELLEGEEDLRERIEKISDKVNFPVTEIYKVDGSQRSGHSNAYYFGFFKNKRIVVYDTLIKQCTNDETEAIILHELGHWHYGHSLQMLGVASLNLLAICYALKFTVYNEDVYKAFDFPQDTFLGYNLLTFLIGPVRNLQKLSVFRNFDFFWIFEI